LRLECICDSHVSQLTGMTQHSPRVIACL
jgi:hypothetical protein